MGTRLGRASLIAFVATARPDRAKSFSGEVLGLRLVTDEADALVFASGATMLRVQKVQRVTAFPYHTAVADLRARGIQFERFGGLPQDDAGIWRAPGGDQVAWFKDPDGNLLSLTKFASA